MMPGRVSPPPKQPGSRWPGFLINRSGLPFDDLTWNELWEFAGYLYPEAKVTLREIQSAPLLQDVPFPTPPPISLAKQGRIADYLQRVHDYMGILGYNHTGTQFFETKPNRYENMRLLIIEFQHCAWCLKITEKSRATFTF